MSIECSSAQIAVQPKEVDWSNVNYPLLARQKKNKSRVVLFHAYSQGTLIQGALGQENIYSESWIMNAFELVPEETGYLISNKFNK